MTDIKTQKGFVTLLPALVIAVAIVASLILVSSVKKTASNVLGDSSEGSSLQSPEPKDTMEPGDTPEPSDTPEPRQMEVEKEVKDGTSEAKIKLHVGDSFQFEQEGINVQVQGKTPLSINPTTNVLTVTTPHGSKDVTVLPVQAVQNMIREGVVSTQSGVLLSTDSSGNPVYQVSGFKYERLLGIFPITIDKTGQVSAVNGQLLGVIQTPLSKLLDALSF